MEVWSRWKICLGFRYIFIFLKFACIVNNMLETENKTEVKGTENFEGYEMIHFSFCFTFRASFHCFKVLSMFTNMDTDTRNHHFI